MEETCPVVDGNELITLKNNCYNSLILSKQIDLNQFFFVTGQSSNARSVRHASILRLQLRRVPEALAVHAAGWSPDAQDLPRQLVPQE